MIWILAEVEFKETVTASVIGLHRIWILAEVEFKGKKSAAEIVKEESHLNLSRSGI